MRVLVLACIAICTPTLASDPIEDLRAAQALFHDDQLEAALTAFTELRNTYPHDVDYALGRAQVLERLGRDDEALEELNQAVQLAPGYDAVTRLRNVILQRRHNPPQWTLLTGGAYDDLSNNLASWNNQFIEVIREVPRENLYAIRVARDARYTQSDLTFGARAVRTLQSGWYVGVDAVVSDAPAFQTETAFGAHAGVPLARGWVTEIAFGQRRYETATVTSVNAGIEKYLADFRLAYRLGHSHLHGGSGSINHALTGNWYVRERVSVGVTLSCGEEAEAIGNGQVLETDVSGVSVSGRWQVSERVELIGWLGTHEQGDFYRRRFLGLAVSIRL